MIARQRISVSLALLLFCTAAEPLLFAQEISPPPSDLKAPELYTKYISADGYPNTSLKACSHGSIIIAQTTTTTIT